ncbi:MAG TPA: hypoxanthine phosphoribosyltransferase [Gammaproteobacteria bacterium]|nr:hypoxanthine phosphoribosyltransferase [Gammaproteobacteria bacterium]
MPEKIYISAEDLLCDAYRLAAIIMQSGFRPDFIIGVWRGGTPVGVAVQELMDYFGIKTDHIAIRTASYTGIGERDDEVRVFGLKYIIRNINAENRLLIVDDVFDTGKSVDAIIHELSIRTRRNTPHDIRIATPWFKPGNNLTDRVPDYYLHETEKWLVFPHELDGLSQEDIFTHKSSCLKEIFQSLHDLNIRPVMNG